MRAAVTRQVRDIEICTVPEPNTADGSDGLLIVAVKAVGLCGTDHHIWTGSYPPAHLPLVQGHEVAGTVVRIPPEDPGGATVLTQGALVVIDPMWSCGHCYACTHGGSNACEHMSVMGVHRDGGLCEQMAVDPARACLVDDSLSPAVATLVEPASISLEAVRRSGAGAGDMAVVIGSGPIGLLAAAALVDAQVRVASVEPDPWRRSLARSAGVEVAVPPGAPSGLPESEDTSAIDSLRSWAGVNGPGVVIEASGTPQGLLLALELICNTGVVVLVGISDAMVILPMSVVPYKAVDVRGSRNRQGSLDPAARFVHRHRDLCELMVTHRFSLTETQHAFAVLEGGAGRLSSVGKVVVEL